MSDAITSWWKHFERQSPRIKALFKRQDKWDLPAWMDEHLGAIHPELMWEYGAAVNGDGARLVITPESRRELRPLVREILKRAPQLDGWEFYEYRLAENSEQAAAVVKGRTGGDLRGMQFQAQLGEYHRVDLTFQSAHFNPDDASAYNIAFVAAESLLGEEVQERWIGNIDVAIEPSESLELTSVENLRDTVEQLVAEIQSTLPNQPWHQTDLVTTGWSVLEAEPSEAADFHAQSDLFVAGIVLPQMLLNAINGVPFDSARYSRLGERFCYLKIDGIEGLESSTFADRGEIDDAINDILRPAQLGSTIGGGTGLRYSYIELALTDVDTAWGCIRAVLREGRVPTRTWLLHHDDEFHGLWSGVYDDTPPPPGPDEEGAE